MPAIKEITFSFEKENILFNQRKFIVLCETEEWFFVNSHGACKENKNFIE